MLRRVGAKSVFLLLSLSYHNIQLGYQKIIVEYPTAYFCQFVLKLLLNEVRDLKDLNNYLCLVSSFICKEQKRLKLPPTRGGRERMNINDLI